MASWATIADALRYGWQVCWALKVEGIPYLFTEYDLDGSAPTGYTIEPSLVVDDSDRIGSQVDDRSGVARSYDLAVRLLSTTVTRDLMSPPSATTRLVLDFDWNDVADVSVEDVSDSDWPTNNGHFYIGREYVAYSVKDAVSSPNTFDTLTRGEPNGEWRSYQYDLRSSLGTWVTNRPILWRGRIVELYAVAVDPGGGVTGANVLSNAALLWRGHISSKPQVSHDGWTLSCRSQERRLEEPIGVEVNGQGTWVYDADPLIEVDPTFAITVTVYWDQTVAPATTTFTLQPFSTLFPGDTIHLQTARALVLAEWSTRLTAIGAPVTSYVSTVAKWTLTSAGQLWPGDNSIKSWWVLEYVGAFGAGVGHHVCHMQIDGQDVTGFVLGGSGQTNEVAGTTADPILVKSPLNCYAANSLDGLEVSIDEGSVSDIPTTGYVLVELGETTYAFEYASVYQLASNSSIVRVVLADGQAGLDQFTADALEGSVDVFEVKFATKLGPESPQDAMRRSLLSSGRGDNDATYDTLSRRAGLDLDSVDTDSFDSELDGAWTELGEQEVLLDKRASWSKVWGPLLALSERCVISRPTADCDAVEIAVVRTSVCDIGTAATTITDDDLLVTGDGSTPIREVELRDSPNVIEVSLRDSRGEDLGTIVSVDDTLRDAAGEQRWTMQAQGFGRTELAPAVGAWAKMRATDAQLLRTYELDVAPWVRHSDDTPIRVGDVVRLEITNFRMSDPSSALAGYSGPARVLGWQITPRDYAARLLVGVSGIFTPYALCPSAEVLAYDHATVTTQIDIGADYYVLMLAYIAGETDFDLVAYVPSYDNATAKGYTVDGVTYVAGAPDVTRLSISAITGAPDLSTATHWLTLPVRASCNDAQLRHMHTNTPGAVWR